jgi:hypothetical protein
LSITIALNMSDSDDFQMDIDRLASLAERLPLVNTGVALRRF